MKKRALLFIYFVFFSTATLFSQRVYIVDKNHPNASDKNLGTAQYPFATINKAALLAGPGDTVLVHSGIYRERVAPVRSGTAENPIIYKSAPFADVYVKGSDVWQPKWKSLGDYIFFGAFDKSAFEIELDTVYGFGKKMLHFNPYEQALRKSPDGLQLTLGQLFVGGKKLLEVDNKETLEKIAGSWMVSSDKTGLLVHFPGSAPPSNFKLVELTVRSRVFAPYKRGLSYIHVDGFHFEHGATNFPAGFWTEKGSPQAGIVGFRAGHHWQISNCTIRHGKSLGLDIGSEGPIDYDGLDQPTNKNSGYHLIKNNIITDNGCGGIAGYISHGSKIVGNTIERNNDLGMTAPEIGGIKLHFFTEGLIEANLIKDNHAYGIWLDNEWHNSRVTKNVIVSNEKAGIFMELGYGPVLIDNNFIAYTKAFSGFGLYSHDASGITFAHNMVFFNAGFGLWAHVATDRTKDLPFDNIDERVQIEASNWRVLNNMFIGNGAGAVSLPVESDISENNLSDFNVVTGGYNRFTFETYAEGLDEPYFLINNNKERQDNRPLYASLGQREDTESAIVPFLTMKQWNELSGNDSNSIYSWVLRPIFAKERLQLSFYIDDKAKNMRCSAIKGIETDFYGKKLPEFPLPGPFQSLKFEEELNDRSKKLEFRGPYNHIKDNDNLNLFMLYPKTTAF